MNIWIRAFCPNWKLFLQFRLLWCRARRLTFHKIAGLYKTCCIYRNWFCSIWNIPCFFVYYWCSCCCTILYELILTVKDPAIPSPRYIHFSCSFLHEHHLLVYSGHSAAWFRRWIYHSTIIMATIRFSALHQALITSSTYGNDTLHNTWHVSFSALILVNETSSYHVQDERFYSGETQNTIFCYYEDRLL